MAKLPNCDNAVVADAKLTDYLLNPVHPRGHAKARFLIRFGFAPDRLEEARTALLGHARTIDISASTQDAFGTIFQLVGPLPSPDGRNPVVTTVWMLDTGATEPRLITLLPRAPRPKRNQP